MRIKINEEIEVPEGISCSIEGRFVKCSKGSSEVSRKIDYPLVSVKIEGNKIILGCAKGNKKDFKTIKSYVAHIKNLFTGLNSPFIYKLESANVHFPMTLKAEKEKLIISNFLGEKTPRFARILPKVDVELKGSKITISSVDR